MRHHVRNGIGTVWLATVLAGGSTAVAGAMWAVPATQPPAVQTGPATPPKGNGIVIGQVVDAGTDQPVAEAIVTIMVRPPAPARGANPGANPAAAAPPARGVGGPVGATPPARGGAGAPNQPTRVMTGADGRFAFYELPAATINLTATAGGYSQGQLGQTRYQGPGQPLTLEEGGRRSDLKIRVWKNAVVSGFVSDEANEPAVRVNVTAMRRTMVSGRPRFQPAGSAMTDDRGLFRISELQPGDYAIAIPQTQSTMPAALSESLMQGLASGTGAQGAAMLDLVSSGGPGPMMGGVRVGEYLLSSSNASGVSPPAPAADGRIVVYQTIYFPAVTTAAQATVLSIKPGEDRGGVNLQLRLVPTFRVAGTLTGPTGAMSNTSVRLQPATDEGFSEGGTDVATTITKADGSFVMLGVPPGQYVARVQKSGRPPIPAELANTPLMQMTFGGNLGAMSAQTETLYAQAAVNVGSGDVNNVALRMSEGARVSGRVEFEGSTAPPTGAILEATTIALTPIDTRIGATPAAAGPNAPGRVGQDLQFKTAAFPSGKYLIAPAGRGPGAGWTLKSVMIGGRDASAELLDLTEADIQGAVVTFTDKVGQLSGTVTSGTNAPVAEATVFLFPADYRSWLRNAMSARRLGSSTVGATGAYTIPRLLAGDYLVGAVAGVDPTDRESPAFFEALARVATRVTIGDAEQKTLALTIVKVTR